MFFITPHPNDFFQIENAVPPLHMERENGFSNDRNDDGVRLERLDEGSLRE
jgi:hypothetical protein